MKKRIACLAIASVMVAGLFAAGCKNGNNAYTEIENADLLALSYDRLENADLSFNFSIDKSVSTASYSHKAEEKTLKAQHSRTSKEKTGYSVDGTDKSVILTPDIIVEPRYTYEFFKDNEEYLERVSRSSRELADFAIENVTVMNTFIDFGYQKYLLDYDRENDVVTVLNYLEMNGKISEYKKISVYYDDDGDETVEYWFYKPMIDGNIIGRTEHAIYCADKTYYFAFNQFGKDSHTGNDYATYNLTTAFKEEGEWRGLHTIFSPYNPVFTHEGKYNYANGIINLEFMVEDGGEIYRLTDMIVPYRNGFLIGSGVEALPDDEFRFDQYYINTPVVVVNCEANLISINMAALDGWSQVKSFTENDKDINKLVLDNGKFAPQSGTWSDEYGWLNLINDTVNYESYYIGEDGQRLEMDAVEKTNMLDFRIELGVPYDENKVQNASLDFFKSNVEEVGFDLVDECLKSCGLSFNGEASRTMLMDMKGVQGKKNGYLKGIYQSLCGAEYTVDNAIAYLLSLKNSLDNFEKYIVEAAKNYRIVSEKEIPEKPANLGLVEFAQNTAGKAVVTKDGIDFSAVSLSVKKSPLLSDGKTYGVTVGFSNSSGSVILDAFDSITYAKSNMNFTGKAGVALPEAEEGEYTLVGFFGRVTEDGVIRLSEICAIAAERFDGFDVTVETEGGSYVYTYTYKNGEVKLTVTFVPDGKA